MNMKLPNDITLIIDKKKITNYLLDINSPGGKAKADFFFENGVTLENIQPLLLRQVHTEDIMRTTETEHGVKYIFESEVEFPNGRKHFLRSVWIQEKTENVVRFVTAYKFK